ncbi:MAG: hypothetical protein M3Q48_17955 [Actinomycetota bacterium]|nr:hypothetical protein [Actinomycetota bacterium]
MLSERSRSQWDTFVRARASDTAPVLERDELHRFLVGVHLRGEELTAHELKELLDGTDLGDEDRLALTSFVSSALGLLTSYDAILEEDQRAYEDDPADDGFEL